MRFILFTKTKWSEPPRLRHQLARLLADAGHDIEFFELPLFPWEDRPKGSSGHPRIRLHRYRQLIHHKLRIAPLLHHLNAAFEKCQILRTTKRLPIHQSDVIVVFNYDYFFIREVFPNHKIILIINDDFWSRAIAGYEKPLKWALQKICRTSDKVLTVSLPLSNQLKAYCSPELFFPWADTAYLPPKFDAVRNMLLFWGYVGGRLDYPYIRSLANAFQSHGLNYEILLVGPIEAGNAGLQLLAGNPRIRFQESSRLDDLPLDQVLCGFIPYRAGVREVDAITLPNKSLQELARGLPQLINGMPAFVNQPFVFRMTGNLEADLNILQALRFAFNDLQPAISAFVSANSAEARLRAFMKYVT